MSKIGRKPIDIGTAKVEVKGQEVHYKGKNNEGVYVLPAGFNPTVDNGQLHISLEKSGKSNKMLQESNRVWGLHRALLANKINGAQKDFIKELEIVGLGYKAVVSGPKVVFSLGYTHKIDFNLPKGIALEVDKTGQKLIFKSFDRELLGQVCSDVRSMRAPEPYKGTGIKYKTETIVRKAGKTKA